MAAFVAIGVEPCLHLIVDHHKEWSLMAYQIALSSHTGLDILQASNLHVAAYLGHAQAVTRLIDEHGADPLALDACGCSALTLAAEAGHADVVYAIVSRLAPGIDTDDAMVVAAIVAAHRRHWHIMAFVATRPAHCPNIFKQVFKHMGAPRRLAHIYAAAYEAAQLEAMRVRAS
jgi:hypothetical protein